MNIKNIKIKIGAVGACIAGLAVLSACSDKWDEHYEARTLKGQTIWNAIQGNSNLSNFARVADSCDYDIRLNGDNMLTVFAPVNSVLTDALADNLISTYKAEKARGREEEDNEVIKQFFNNHVALNNKSVSTSTNDSLTMINGKYIVLTPTTFGSTQLLTSNELYDNGILYTIGNIEEYFPNVYEALDDYEGIDSIAAFLNSFDQYEFDESQSVAGGIDSLGRTTYLDSVMYLSNAMLQSYGYIDREDSVYWMLAPNNDQWNTLVDKYSQYFNYDRTIRNTMKGDSLQWVNTRKSIFRQGIYNYRQMKSVNDSIMATSYNSYYDEMGDTLNNDYYKFMNPSSNIFSNVDTYSCSNGRLMVSKGEWPISEFQTFVQHLLFEGEYNEPDSIVNSQEPLTVVRVDENNVMYDSVSQHSYLEAIPIASGSRPSLYFDIPNLFSNVGYDIYIAMVPAVAGDSTSRDVRPMRIRCSLQWNGENGVKSNWTTLNYNGQDHDVAGGKYEVVQVASNQIIPTCTYGIDEPQVRLWIQSRVTSSNTATLSPNLRIDYIMFKPHVE